MSYIRFGSKVRGQKGGSGVHAYGSTDGGIEIMEGLAKVVLTRQELEHILASYEHHRRMLKKMRAPTGKKWKRIARRIGYGDRRLEIERLEATEMLESVPEEAGFSAGGPREICAVCHVERRYHTAQAPTNEPERHSCPMPLAFRSRNPVLYQVDELPCCSSLAVEVQGIPQADGCFARHMSRCVQCGTGYGPDDLDPRAAGVRRQMLNALAEQLFGAWSDLHYELHTPTGTDEDAPLHRWIDDELLPRLAGLRSAVSATLTDGPRATRLGAERHVRRGKHYAPCPRSYPPLTAHKESLGKEVPCTCERG